ncbi:hypothetical protein [[Mycobacterium] wendilense]|uniref:Uncharacterized protein n=1 Tax=[Mycobacterium] wendilense TaxID=3064284 RepID=A0ABM9MBQ4_9MYCO|nr:hypothetical protein [Mycolicibacterium sp. MU0050]CAJ1581262.1 hypothetical protein MU0050_001469 [Mycolicibacterium sp. MU0050]
MSTGIDQIGYEDLGSSTRFGEGASVKTEVTAVNRRPSAPNRGTRAEVRAVVGGDIQGVTLFGRTGGKAISAADAARTGPLHHLGGSAAVSAVAILQPPEGPGRGK